MSMPGRGLGGPRILRRLAAFTEQYAHCDITMADLAASEGVTPRAIQLMFRRHWQITPMQYLKEVRLESAHRDLLANCEASTSGERIGAKMEIHTPRTICRNVPVQVRLSAVRNVKRYDPRQD
jgi:AraC-like DNA-binding protein